jgi:hypothetical protein
MDLENCRQVILQIAQNAPTDTHREASSCSIYSLLSQLVSLPVHVQRAIPRQHVKAMIPRVERRRGTFLPPAGNAVNAGGSMFLVLSFSVYADRLGRRRAPSLSIDLINQQKAPDILVYDGTVYPPRWTFWRASRLPAVGSENRRTGTYRRHPLVRSKSSFTSLFHSGPFRFARDFSTIHMFGWGTTCRIGCLISARYYHMSKSSTYPIVQDRHKTANPHILSNCRNMRVDHFILYWTLSLVGLSSRLFLSRKKLCKTGLDCNLLPIQARIRKDNLPGWGPETTIVPQSRTIIVNLD